MISLTVRDFALLMADLDSVGEVGDFTGDGWRHDDDVAVMADNIFAQADAEAPCQAMTPGEELVVGQGNVRLISDPLAGPVELGETVSVRLDVEALGQAINGVQVVLGYDPEVLTLLSADAGDGAGSVWDEAEVLTTPVGDDKLAILAMVPGSANCTTDDATVVRLVFEAVGNGLAEVAFAEDGPLAQTMFGTLQRWGGFCARAILWSTQRPAGGQWLDGRYFALRRSHRGFPGGVRRSG